MKIFQDEKTLQFLANEKDKTKIIGLLGRNWILHRKEVDDNEEIGISSLYKELLHQQLSITQLRKWQKNIISILI